MRNRVEWPGSAHELLQNLSCVFKSCQALGVLGMVYILEKLHIEDHLRRGIFPPKKQRHGNGVWFVVSAFLSEIVITNILKSLITCCFLFLCAPRQWI